VIRVFSIIDLDIIQA